MGTIGLAVVQFRNVLTRRGELALLTAIGFSHRRIRRLLVWENAAVLLVGLGVGAGAALIAVIPHALVGAAHLPLSAVTGLLSLILVVGLLAGLLTAHFALRTPILQALRDE